MERVFLGIDLGTSSVKVAAMNEQRAIMARSSASYKIHHPSPSWSEQNPQEWWDAVVLAVTDVAKQLDGASNQIVSIGLSGQMHGLVVLGSDGTPLRNAIIWPDGRSAEICNDWKQRGYATEFQSITGLPLVPGFMAPSLEWVRRHEGHVFSQVRSVLLPKDYIRFRLTGAIETEATDACGTYLFDVRTRAWSEDILEAMGFPADILPRVIPSCGTGGVLAPAPSKELGLRRGLPVCAGGSDQAMAALGLGLRKPGTAAIALGTGAQTITPIEAPLVDYRIHTLCGSVDSMWIAMGATLAGGVALSWLRSILNDRETTIGDGHDLQYEEMSRMASTVDAGSNGLFFGPYLLGDRTPHMNPRARGCFLGLHASHSRAHMIRSVMEGVAYSIRETFDIFGELGLDIQRVLVYAGGSRNAVWGQILADTINCPIHRMADTDYSVIGAAQCAAVSLGYSVLGPEPVETEEPDFSPDRENVKTYNEGYGVYRSIYPAISELFDPIAQLQPDKGA